MFLLSLLCVFELPAVCQNSGHNADRDGEYVDHRNGTQCPGNKQKRPELQRVAYNMSNLTPKCQALLCYQRLK